GRVKSLMERCPDGFFGYKCRYRCQCQQNVTCDKVTGYCPDGCKEGFWGHSCQLDNSCYYNNQRRAYTGNLSYTKSMLNCQRWEAQTPHAHKYAYQDFTEREFPKNYCRTTPDSDRPWCYTTDSRHRWDYYCPDGRFGPNCSKECHCKDDNDKCDSMKGICHSGCAKGWAGFDCQTPDECPENHYGWECGLICQCENPRHCDRFVGPTKYCVCKKGFFNPPNCEPVTAPRFVFFGNEIVNPGQPAVFNCTIAAFPAPSERDIQLIGAEGKKFSPVSYIDLQEYLYTRLYIFRIKKRK
ncbi:hypothetical protein Btru_056427, partial [Bulinus truncatus]